jgi:hypothetical protein
MISAPTEGIVSWYDDAIGEVFNVTNGNPYFAKLVCAQALEVAISARDTDISLDEVRTSIDSKISILGANSFIHLWQDGIPKPIAERDPDILRRLRVLVAIARCLRHKLSSTIPHIFESRGNSMLSEGEISAVLNDFVRREVLVERGGVYTFLLPIFEKWLVDVGVAQLASDSLTAELADSVVAEELAVAVRADEIAELVRSWPAYRGRHVGGEEIREWFQQVSNPKDQRLLFTLLRRLRVMNEGRVRESLEHSFSFLQPLPEFVIRRKSDRRRNIVVTYVDGEGKSGYSYAAIFAEANSIASDCIFPPGEFDKRIQKHKDANESIDSLVIIDDLVGTGKSLLANVESFLQLRQGSIDEGLPIRIIALAATSDGQRKLLAGLQKLSHSNIDFRACEILGPELYAFPDDKSGWASSEDFDRAKALCVDLGRRSYKKSPLGFGDKGLLLIFPTNTPNNSIPILHSASIAGSSHSWKPLFSRVTH